MVLPRGAGPVPGAGQLLAPQGCPAQERERWRLKPSLALRPGHPRGLLTRGLRRPEGSPSALWSIELSAAPGVKPAVRGRPGGLLPRVPFAPAARLLPLPEDNRSFWKAVVPGVITLSLVCFLAPRAHLLGSPKGGP